MKLLFSLFALSLLSSCGLGPVANDPQFEYTRANVYKNLEIPPDLTIEKSDTFSIPGIDGLDASVPDYKDAKLVRNGTNLWLEINGNIDLIWSRLHDFLNLQGIEIQNSDRLSGLITSTWLSNQTGIVSGDLLDNLQSSFLSSNYLDQYIISVERTRTGKTKVVILHNAKSKVALTDESTGGVSEQWANTPSNPSLQLTLLKKFMAYSGLSSLLNKQGFDKVTLNNLFKEKVINKNQDDHFITVKKSSRLVFDKIQKVAFDIFDVEKIRVKSNYIVIKQPYQSVRLETKKNKKEERNLVRIQVLKVGYDTKIVIRNDRGESIDLVTTDKILNKLIKII